MKLFLQILFISSLFIIFSCKRESENYEEIELVDDEEYIRLLANILNDTVNGKILKSNNVVLANKNIVHSPIFHLGEISEIDFLCDILEESDTIFIKNQYKDSILFDLSNLSKFKFQVYDLKKNIEVKDFDSIQNEIKKINIENGNPHFLNRFYMIPRPVINKKRDRALIRVNGLVGGETFLAIKTTKSWKKEKIGHWMH